ncbi:MAG: HAD-IB family hydrolase [Tunicatimonas sp.]
MPQPPVLALFDFDGTITRRDTLFDFIRFYRGRWALYRGLVQLTPALLAYKLGFTANWVAKERVLTHFFGGESESAFRRRAADYAHQRLPQIIRPSALQKIRAFKEQQATVYVVSASAEDWIRPWCETLEVQLLATRLEKQQQKISGKIAGKNCHGPEKVRRIREELALSQYSAVYAYGDSSGDREMLTLAHYPHYRYFK